MKVELVVRLGNFEEVTKLVQQVTTSFLHKHIDLTYVFLKTINKRLNFIKDPEVLKDLCEHTLKEILTKLISSSDTKSTSFVYSKIVEISLKILYKSWKVML